MGVKLGTDGGFSAKNHRLSLIILAVATAVLGNDPDAVAGLREGARAAADGRVSDAYRSWQAAAGTASSTYLRVEALARLAGESRGGVRERQDALARLGTVFATTPPRWLTDEARKVLAEQLAAVTGAEVRSQSFAPGLAGSGFRGKRYLWLAGLPALPPPPADPAGRDQPDDAEQLPVPRVPAAGGSWAVVDPWHARADAADPGLRKWRFDRCLLGYTFEPVEQRRNLMGNLIWDPLEPWYPTDGGLWQIWRLRFRVFYTSPALGAGADYAGLARELLDTLLRAQWVGREHLGRQATDARQQPDVLDVWLTENSAEQFDEAGGERWYNNLYFYQLATPRAPGEWLREALHEYAHAILPKTGRYLASRRYETWLEGYLGERLLLRCLGAELRAEDAPRAGWLASYAGELLPADYRARSWDPPLAVFLDQGPTAPARLGGDDAAADWLAGFVEWVAEAHEPSFLHQWLGLLSGNSQLGAEALLATYQARVKDQAVYRLYARRPARSLGGMPPRITADGAELRPRSEVEYWAFLPDRPLALRLLGPRSAVVSLKVDNGPARIVEIGPEATAPSTPVQGLGKWQRITVASAAEEPAVLGWIEVRRAAAP